MLARVFRRDRLRELLHEIGFRCRSGFAFLFDVLEHHTFELGARIELHEMLDGRELVPYLGDLFLLVATCDDEGFRFRVVHDVGDLGRHQIRVERDVDSAEDLER